MGHIHIDTTRKYSIIISAVLLSLLILFYLFLLNSSVQHVVSRLNLNRLSSMLQSEVALLEGNYFTIQKNSTLTHALDMNYLEAPAVQYVDTYGSSITVLTLSN